MAYQNDTPVKEAERTHPADPQKIGSGSAEAPGGSAAKPQSAHEMSQGQEGYPGPRDAGEDVNTPEAGDKDPDSSKSAEETGQGGDPNQPNKSTGNPWNG